MRTIRIETCHYNAKRIVLNVQIVGKSKVLLDELIVHVPLDTMPICVFIKPPQESSAGYRLLKSATSCGAFVRFS